MKRTLISVVAASILLAACGPASIGGVLPDTSPTPGIAYPSPGTSTPLTKTDLKYLLLATYPDFFFCDPDVYPIARAIDPVQLARQHLPEMQADVEAFAAILRHNGLSGLTTFTDDQVVLIYSDWKKLNALQLQPVASGYSFAIVTSPGPVGKAQGLLIQGQIQTSGSIVEISRTPTIATCPICLSAGTRIDTPSGQVLITKLKIGDLVWTMNAGGERVAAPILELTRTPVAATHQMVHLVLSDGRELWASAAHPTTDGRRVGDLAVGDLLDGARVTVAERVAYGLPATYDLLPAGGTGFYWANGILLASTLALH